MNAMFGIDRSDGRGPLTLAGMGRAFGPRIVWVTFPGALPQAGMEWAVGAAGPCQRRNLSQRGSKALDWQPPTATLSPASRRSTNPLRARIWGGGKDEG